VTTYNILDFGARGDARANDAAAIQRAIDTCAAAGGGTVLVPAGRTYRSGGLALKSNVELHVERGATLLASGDLGDYPRELESDTISAGALIENDLPRRAFIVAYWADSIAITGGGVIDGNGRAFVAEDLGYVYRMAGERQHLERPFAILLIACSNVTMRDITVRDAAFWTVRAAGCEDLLIHGVRIDNDLKLPNNDGLAIDCCRNVRISDCHIVADNGICLKACCATVAAGLGVCENITVAGCTLVSTSAALKIGNEVTAPIRNAVFNACIVRGSHRGIAIHLGQGADIENVLFSNMVVETRVFDDLRWGRGEPIYVSAIPCSDQAGHVRHVRFSNILCRGESGIFVQGRRPGMIDDLLFENVRVELDLSSQYSTVQHGIQIISGETRAGHPTAGFFVKQASNVTIRNCGVSWGECRPEYFRHALETHGVANLVTENFSGVSAHPDRYAPVVSD
jgi:polygalacturonase